MPLTRSKFASGRQMEKPQSSNEMIPEKSKSSGAESKNELATTAASSHPPPPPEAAAAAATTTSNVTFGSSAEKTPCKRFVDAFAQMMQDLFETKSTSCTSEPPMWWSPDGSAIFIKSVKSKQKCDVIRPYFPHANIHSCRRLMYSHGWVCVKEGPNKGALFHPLFQRGRLTSENLEFIKSQKRGSNAVAAIAASTTKQKGTVASRTVKNQGAKSQNKAHKKALPDISLSQGSELVGDESFTPTVSSGKTSASKNALLQQKNLTSPKNQSSAKIGKTSGRKTLLKQELQRMSPIVKTKPRMVSSSSSTTSSSPVDVPDKDSKTASSSPSCNDCKTVSWDEEEEPINFNALAISAFKAAAAIDNPETTIASSNEESQQPQSASTDTKAFTLEQPTTEFCGCGASAAVSEELSRSSHTAIPSSEAATVPVSMDWTMESFLDAPQSISIAATTSSAAFGPSGGATLFRSGAGTQPVSMEWSLEAHNTAKAVDTSQDPHKASSTSISMETTIGYKTNASNETHSPNELKSRDPVVSQSPRRVSSVAVLPETGPMYIEHLEAALPDISSTFDYSSPEAPGSCDDLAVSFEDAYVELLDMEWVSNGEFSPMCTPLVPWMFHTVTANQPVGADEVFPECDFDFDETTSSLPTPKSLTYDPLMAESPPFWFTAHADEDKMPSIESAVPIPDPCSPPVTAPTCLDSSPLVAHNNSATSTRCSHPSDNNSLIEEV